MATNAMAEALVANTAAVDAGRPETAPIFSTFASGASPCSQHAGRALGEPFFSHFHERQSASRWQMRQHLLGDATSVVGS
mmetsp:Transcript_65882/g.169536  ORF Transcript_65882/g.169536 Transcript_65882/m.169536 type:complete len:80 (+) Transcript_65882:270-509(+)